MTKKFSDFLIRRKEQILIIDNEYYKRVTIRTNHNGVLIRDEEIGKNIGTKNQFLVREGQFILSKIDARNGAFGIVPSELDKAIITGNFWTYDVNDTLIDIRWLNLFTSTPEFLNICIEASSGTTNRKYLDEKKFLGHQLHLPNLTEQEKTIELFEQITNIQNDLFSQIDRIEALKNSVLASYF